MGERFRLLWEILRQEGPRSLGAELRRSVIRRAGAIAAWVRGELSFEGDPLIARFRIRSYGEALNLIRTYETERGCLRTLMRHLRNTDTFWDIGAYHGLYSILAAPLCQQVIAFEPYPPNAQRIAINSARNGLRDRVRVLEIALSDQEGIAGFDLRGGQRAFMMGSVVPGLTSGHAVLIAPGDLLISHGVPPPDVVKIDVEGHECRVLNGMRNLLRRHVRFLICEVHEAYLIRHGLAGCVEKLLDELGFKIACLDRRRTEYFLQAEK